MELIEKVKMLHEHTIRSIRTYDKRDLYNDSYDYMIKFAEYSRKKYCQWEGEQLLHERNCPVCGSNKTKTVLDKSDIDGCRYSKCVNCGFVYSNPMPPETHYNDIYISGFDGLDKWLFGRKEYYGRAEEQARPPYPILNRIRKKKNGGLFLDFGCGTGWKLYQARNMYDVYGVDIDAFRIKKARELLGDPDGRKIIDLGNLDEASFRGKFDVVHAAQNVEHLLEPMKYLKRFYDWLKPGGILYFSSPASDSFAFSFLEKRNSMAVLGHVSLFNRKSLKYALANIGFEDIEVQHDGLDVSATEFWKRIFSIDFVHRHSFVDNKLLASMLYPPMLVTTAVLQGLTLLGLLKGNYFHVFAKKREKAGK